MLFRSTGNKRVLGSLFERQAGAVRVAFSDSDSENEPGRCEVGGDNEADHTLDEQMLQEQMLQEQMLQEETQAQMEEEDAPPSAQRPSSADSQTYSSDSSF